MGALGSTVTHVANATDGPLHVMYSTDEMKLREAVLKANNKGDGSAKMTFRSSDRVTYERIPRRNFAKFDQLGPLYFTAIAEKNDRYTTVCENKKIQNNRSFIVTKSLNFKWQKYGENIWMDEQGNIH